jgi:hypothetical protein
MAALLHIAPPHGASTAADTIARLSQIVTATLHQQRAARPMLVCRWLQDPDGRLACHWELLPPDVPIPPH